MGTRHLSNDYKIGDLASFTDISRSGVRFLEEAGVITAARDEQSGYRKYAEDDFATLTIYSILRSIGFTLEEARDFLQSEPAELAVPTQAMRERLRENYERSLRMLDSIEAHAAAAAHAGEKWEVLSLGGIACFPVPEDAYRGKRLAIEEIDALTAQEKRWQMAMPSTSFGYFYREKADTLDAPSTVRLIPCRCYLASLDTAQELDLDRDSLGETLIVASGLFLHRTAAVPLVQADGYGIPDYQDAMRSAGLKMRGDLAVARVLHLRRSPETQEVYLDIFLPVETFE